MANHHKKHERVSHQRIHNITVRSVPVDHVDLLQLAKLLIRTALHEAQHWDDPAA